MDLKTVDLRLAVTNTLPTRNQPVKIHCREPTHDDREQSLAVYADGIKCFGCGLVLSRRMEALAYLLFHDRARWREAIKEAAQYIGPGSSVNGNRAHVQEQAIPTLPPAWMAELYYDNLLLNREESYEDLKRGRGLTPWSVYQFCLGHDGARFTIPIYDANNQLIAIRYRRDDRYAMGQEGSKYYGTHGHNEAVLYPATELYRHEGNTLAIVEGEFDAIRCWQAGIPTATMTNGAGSMEKLPTALYALCPWVRTLVLIGDMDEPGRDAMAKTGYAAALLRYHTERLTWDPGDGKDVTEYCLRNNEARLKALWKALIGTLPSASTNSITEKKRCI